MDRNGFETEFENEVMNFMGEEESMFFPILENEVGLILSDEEYYPIYSEEITCDFKEPVKTIQSVQTEQFGSNIQSEKLEQAKKTLQSESVKPLQSNEGNKKIDQKYIDGKWEEINQLRIELGLLPTVYIKSDISKGDEVMGCVSIEEYHRNGRKIHLTSAKKVYSPLNSCEWMAINEVLKKDPTNRRATEVYMNFDKCRGFSVEGYLAEVLKNPKMTLLLDDYEEQIKVAEELIKVYTGLNPNQNQKSYSSLLDALKFYGRYPEKKNENKKKVPDMGFINAAESLLSSDEKILFACYDYAGYVEKKRIKRTDKKGKLVLKFLDYLPGNIVIITDKNIIVQKDIGAGYKISRDRIIEAQVVDLKEMSSIGQVQIELNNDRFIAFNLDIWYVYGKDRQKKEDAVKSRVREALGCQNISKSENKSDNDTSTSVSSTGVNTVNSKQELSQEKANTDLDTQEIETDEDQYSLSAPRITSEGTVLFGNYHGDIEWYIIGQKGNMIRLLSRYTLDFRKFDDDPNKNIWNECALRKWLNQDFYNEAFDEGEKTYINRTFLMREDYPRDEESLSKVENYVVLLNKEEAETLVKDNDFKNIELTEYAKEQGRILTHGDEKLYSDLNKWWWLRSVGRGGKNYVARMHTNGHIDTLGCSPDTLCIGVRPSIVIKLDE